MNGLGVRQKEGESAMPSNAKDFSRDKGLVKASAADILSSFALLLSLISFIFIKSQIASCRGEKQSGRLNEVKCHFQQAFRLLEFHCIQDSQLTLQLMKSVE
jgi:hypothetical protein